jgi:hypothetical protein
MSYLAGLLLVVALAVAARAREPLSLDAPVQTFQLPGSIPPCGLTTALARLARSNTMLVGLERARGCAANEYPQLDLSNAELLTDVSKRVVLDRILALVPGYSWREVEGVAVVRPASAWADTKSLLAARVPAFRGPYDATVPHLMNAVFRRPDNPPHKRTMADKQIFPATFSGGTLLQGLNALIRAAQQPTTSGEWTFRQDEDMVDIEILTLFELKLPGAVGGIGARPVYFSERLKTAR